MEHGKFSISKIWHIAKMEYIKLIMDPRMILIVAALCLCLMAVGRDSVYIDGTFVQHSGDSAEAFLRPEAQTEKAAL